MTVIELRPPVADLLNAPAWMNDALCREYPDVSFFPARGESVDRAKTICARCLVRAECLAFVREMPVDTEGIWGGTSHRERRLARSGRHLSA